MKTIVEKKVDELEAYKGMWRNLYFLKDGSTFVAAHEDSIWLTAEKANEVSAEFIRSSLEWHLDCAKRGSRGILNMEVTGGKNIYSDSLSYAIPIPVKS